ncbi:MAG: AraC family transcriptional regulator [Eubacteriales bacterium]
MEFYELDAFLNTYTIEENRARIHYLQALDTKDADLLNLKSIHYRHFPDNLTHDHDTPIRICRHERYVNVEYHTHNVLEIMYQYSGNCFQTIDGESMTLRSGEFCFVSPGVLHLPEINDDSILINILIDIPTLSQMCELFHTIDSDFTKYLCAVAYRKKYPKYLTIRPKEKDEKLDRLMRELILEYYNNEPFFEQMMFTRCQTVILHLLRCHESDTAKTQETFSKNEPVLPIIQYIHHHIRHVTLDMIAQQFNYNKDYVCRLIHKQTGSTFQQYLMNLRISHAKFLLQSTDLSFAEIAWDCGYKSNAYFHRAFRQAVGMTPMQFRENRH